MEQSPENILDTYRQASMNRRLHLYLSYRDLRSEFLEIEQKEHPLESSPRIPSLKRKRKLYHYLGSIRTIIQIPFYTLVKGANQHGQ